MDTDRNTIIKWGAAYLIVLFWVRPFALIAAYVEIAPAPFLLGMLFFTITGAIVAHEATKRL